MNKWYEQKDPRLVHREFNMSDIHYMVVADVYAYRVEFQIFEIIGHADDGKGNYIVPLFRKAGAADSMDSVLSLDESEPYLHGDVKWDGCSNWHFDEQDRVMLHACSRDDLTNIGLVMARCWDLTKHLCPNWSDI